MVVREGMEGGSRGLLGKGWREGAMVVRQGMEGVSNGCWGRDGGRKGA